MSRELDRGELTLDLGQEQLRQLVRQRILAQQDQIQRSLVQINAGNPLGAEPSEARRVSRIVLLAREKPVSILHSSTESDVENETSL